MRRARAGPLTWLTPAHFFVVEELVLRGWIPLAGPYSRRTDFLSDLGAVRCGPYRGRQICSPDHVWMNLSFGLVGAAIGLGAVLLRRSTPELVTRPVVVLYLVGGAGSAMVGLFPEDTGGQLHVVGAGAFFVGAHLGHVLLGSRLLGSRLGGHARAYGTALALVGAVGLAATVLVATGVSLGLGRGLVQRVAVYGANLGFVATATLLLVTTRIHGHPERENA